MTAYFVDLDGVLVKPGTREFLPGARERLGELLARSDSAVFFFSCWAFTDDDVRWLYSHFPSAKGYIRKPLADAYVVIDDKLNCTECRTAL